ncbi:MAG: SIMPL domain-containing protein, partial [Thermoleophilia bacterium]|nr:SIMPL domain-containing protein [Thermoleophilia bacterium]
AEHEHIEEPDARGRVVSRSVVRGHYGICDLRVEAEAGRAAAIVGAAGSHPDVAAVRPGFAIGAALRRTVERELEQDAVRDALTRGAALAEAAGMRCGEVLAIGEPPATADPHEGHIILASMQMDDGALEEAIGELVPEAQTLSARVPVRLALMPAG